MNNSFRQRFGYFSIIYSPYIGDKQYTGGRLKNYRTEEGNVITEKRGIYTGPSKKGKLRDALFSNMFMQDKDYVKKIKELASNEKEDYLKEVKERANKPAEMKFHPTGPQEYKD